MDVLLLHSDHYEGENLEQYETVMQAFAKGHDWAAVKFCNGISQWLEYAGRLPVAKSRWERLRREISDAKRTIALVEETVGALISQGTTPTGGSGAPSVTEIWTDGQSAVAYNLLSKYKQAIRVLYPHGEGAYVGTNHWAIKTPHSRGGWKQRWRDRVVSLIPNHAIMPSRFGFDQAYTFLAEHYLANEVFDVDSKLTREAFRRFFTFLPTEAQAYFSEIGSISNSGRPPSLLLLSTTRGPQDFEKELAALIHLMDATAGVRGGAPVIVKPHPRGPQRDGRTAIRVLKDRFPRTSFIVVDQWGAVPIEVAASNWQISCCLGLYTSALGTLHRRHNLPAYTPFESLRSMYSGDPEWEKYMDHWLKVDEHALIQV